MAIAAAVISPLIDVVGELFSKLKEDVVGAVFSKLKEEVDLIRGVDKELDNLKTTLSMNQGVLEDAEERQITNKAVKKWLADLKNVAYDAEDVLDEFAYEVQRQKLMEHGATKRRKTSSFFSKSSFQRNVAHEIKEIKERVDRIWRDGERFGLRVTDIRQIADIVPRPPSSSSVIAKNSDYVGRDNDIKKIMNMLLSDEDASDGTKDVSVISIVGMGGLGKTTLAQLVYNNETVQKHFRVKAWVCVSEAFDISRLTREIIESAATGESRDLSTLDSMQCRLREILTEKRFLIVLDDVWNTDQSAWDGLQPPFSYGAKGSKIIVTTRDEVVSRTMGTDHFYPLKLLSDDYCLFLFLRHAFGREDCNAQPELKEIGKELVESHCHGLPLAAKVLGCLLSSNRDESFWRSILNSQLWSSKEGENEVMEALGISYHHLPPHIKQCFAFCSIFPKDYKFPKEKLVNFWMAQGFIQPKHGFTSSTLEEIGSEYFDFLLSMSFFQEEQHPWSLRIKVYKMHDCIHDLAMLVSSDECFRFGGKPDRILASRYRHAPMVCDHGIVNLKDLYDCKGIRTVIIKRSDHLTNQILIDLIVSLRYLRVLVLKCTMITKLQLPDSISNLKHLRYLSLSSARISQLPESMSSLYNLQTLVLKESRVTEVPDSISNLKYLRYLDLSFTKISQLPESVSSLHNLQTLLLGYCCNLRRIPKETRKLVNLRHLDLQECSSLQSMPQDIGSLTNLQTLGLFIVGRERGCGIKELKGLTALEGWLRIKNLANVSNAKEAEEANLKDKNLDPLILGFGYDEKANTNMQHEELGKIVEALQPPINLKSLVIEDYGGKNFPSWIQCLTSLKRLCIRGCPQLSLPEGLPTSLHCLDIIGCTELKKRCRKEDGEDWPKISHIRYVVIY